MVRAGLPIWIVVLATTLAVCRPAKADPPVTVVPEPKVVVVMKGEPAPFSGVLVPEGRFTELLRAEAKVDDLLFRLDLQIKTTNDLEAMFMRRLDEAIQGQRTPWYERPSFNRWLGYFLGVVTTGLIVWGGVELVDQIAR